MDRRLIFPEIFIPGIVAYRGKTRIDIDVAFAIIGIS